MIHHRHIRLRSRRLLNFLSSRRGAIDLPSIMIGVAVVAILSVGITATVFGAIPWAQNHSAKQNIVSVRSAEGIAANSHGKFLDTAALKKAGYLESTAGIGIVTNGKPGEKGCFVTVMQSKSGKMFYGSDTMTEAAELKTGAKDPCVLGAKLQDAIDEAGGKIVAGKDVYTVTKSGGSDARSAPDTPAEVSLTPVVTEGLAGKDVTEMMVGTQHSCVIADNQPWCWGMQSSYRLGNGVNADAVLQGAVVTNTSSLPAGKKVHSLSGFNMTTCAIADAKAYCWGHNGEGQIDPSNRTVNFQKPTLVPGMAARKVTDVAAGHWNTCAVSDGALYCWGQNSSGINANGLTGTTYQVPTKVAGALANKTVTDVELAVANGCAVADGALYCWGAGTSGQLTSANGNSLVPVKIPGLPKGTIGDITVGDGYVCAVVDTNLWCWGKNAWGEIGNGTTTNVTKPYRVKGALQGKAVETVDGGFGLTCAIASGEPYCWGGNKFGQHGTGSAAATVLSPVKVPLAAGTMAAEIFAGRYSTGMLAVKR